MEDCIGDLEFESLNQDSFCTCTTPRESTFRRQPSTVHRPFFVTRIEKFCLGKKAHQILIDVQRSTFNVQRSPFSTFIFRRHSIERCRFVAVRLRVDLGVGLLNKFALKSPNCLLIGCTLLCLFHNPNMTQLMSGIGSIIAAMSVVLMMNNAQAFQQYASFRSPLSTSTSSASASVSSSSPSSTLTLTSTALLMNKKGASRRDRDRSTPKGFGAAIRQLQLETFPYAGEVRPGNQSPQRIVLEESVVKPDYWQDGLVRDFVNDHSSAATISSYYHAV